MNNKTFLTRNEAWMLYDISEQTFDSLLNDVGVRRMGDRLHRDDIALLAAQFKERNITDWEYVETRGDFRIFRGEKRSMRH